MRENEYQDWTEGKLCEKGFMKERYNEENGELERTLTSKGLEEVKEMLKDPKWLLVAKAISEGFTRWELDKFMDKMGITG